MTNPTSANPLICDPLEGVCGIADSPANLAAAIEISEKPLKMIYFTDPICSSCWGIEPQLRKLKLEYGNILEIEYRMGGLLPDWSYNSGGISKPSDVAHHWDEVSLHYDMPIDGDVWLEDPLPSSFPPSIAFKAAQLQGYENALAFLREIREMVFMKKKNITKWEHLKTAAENVGLDIELFKSDYEGNASLLFEQDLKIARDNGVRGFPSIFFSNQNGEKEFIYGTKPYPAYEDAILKLYPQAAKKTYDRNWESLFSIFNTLTAKEFATLSGIPRLEGEILLSDLNEKQLLQKTYSKNGALWQLKAGLEKTHA